MASWAKPEPISPPERKDLALVPPPDFAVQSIGRSLPRVETPDGWIKKVDRAREGKVWIGYFHVWEQKPDGTRVRRKREKALGPVTKPTHEALKELSDYIAEYTSEAPKQGQRVSTFSDLWQAFCAVQSGQWSKKTKENLQCLFKKHVLAVIGQQAPREVTLTTCKYS
jgi:hypothetical protein